MNLAKAAKGKWNATANARARLAAQAAAAKARWNAGAQARANFAAKAKAVASQVGTTATQFKNRMTGPAAAANTRVANAAKVAVTANQRVIATPNAPAVVMAAANANKKLNTAMVSAARVNNKIAQK